MQRSQRLRRSLLAGLLALSGVGSASAQNLTIKDGLQFWLKADAGVTAAGGKVSAWADQSGQGNNALQSDGTSQPALVTDAANGKPALRFDGDDDFLAVADSPSVSIAGDITTFFVVKFDNFDTYRAVWAKTQVNQPAPNDWYALPGSGIPRAYRGDGTGRNGFADGGKALPAAQLLIAGYSMAGNRMTHYYKAFATGGGTISTDVLGDADTTMFVGTREDRVTKMKGDIAEILIYNRSLSSSDRAAVVSYLGAKYLYAGMDPAGDPDGDGLTTGEELTLGTDPTNANSDEDGYLTDGDEVKKYKSDPNALDTDGDGLSDVAEVRDFGTDPTKTDSDGDTYADGQELALGTDPANAKSKPVLTSVGVVTGSAPGQGLDLNGNFIYALAIGGGDEAAVQVRDAQFQPLVESEVPGATLSAGNQIVNWYGVTYGDSAEDVALAAATSSIRWSNAADAAKPEVVLTLENLEVGAEYKVQLLFGEACCNRGFDVFFDDQLVVNDFNPGVVQGGINNRRQEAVISRIHFARATKLVIRLDGRTAPFPDHNAILNAVTVERMAGKTDTDNDGLPDEWEKLYHGGLSQDAKTDVDGDGLGNGDEYAAGTDPNVADTDLDKLSDSQEKTFGTNPLAADSDGDGLKDGDELNVHKTDPLKADTDGDALNDGPEILTYKTDPMKKDTDGDGAEDGKEVAAGTDPLKAVKPTVVSNVRIEPFSGGDPGEGLDLQGKFIYAINVSSAGAAGKAGDADFTADNIAGVRVVAANNIPAWNAPEYGDSAADNVIEKVTSSIRYDTVWRVELNNLIPDSLYRLQLLFFEQCCAGRGFNVLVDGVLVAEAFKPADVQGGVNNVAAGAVISADIQTYGDKMIIIGDGPAGRAAKPDEINDTNAILDGVTLEALKEGTPPATAPSLKVSYSQGQIVLTFEGTLQEADTVTGVYKDVPGTGSVTVSPTGAQKFYRSVRK